MSNIRRDHEKSFSISKSSTSNEHRNSKDDNERYHRKRTNSTRSNDHSNSQRISNIDAKVYVGNVPTDNLTDSELLDFFKPFGKVSDIRVYKGYIFVQYDRVDDARKLIEEGETSLILKGNKLDILPAMEASSTNTKSSSTETSYKDYKSSERQSSRSSRQHSSNYEPPRKRYPPKHHTDDNDRHKSSFIINNENNYGDSNRMEIDDGRHMYSSSSRSCSHRLSRSPNDHSLQPNYTTLIGPDDPRQLVDCQIILVNPRQRGYGEEISSHLRCHGLVTSVILLREDYTLIDAIENAAQQQCLYGIIAMPMHEERRTASFHILYGQTEEHRNLTLEDGYHIILTNFAAYKERIRNDELNSYHRPNNETIIYPEVIQSTEYIRQEQPIGPTLSLGDKLPLSMLLCLLADGRQLTLEEIDRVLVYLLDKKAKMLTLPQGTLPPLPAQYATIKTNHQTGSGILSDPKSIPTITDPSITTTNSSLSSEFSSTIAEQIRQILSTNMIKPSSLTSTDELCIQHGTTNNSLDIIKNEDKNISQSKNNVKEGGKDYNHYQQTSSRQIQSLEHNIIPEQQKAQPSFSYSKSNSNSVAVVAPSFHYSSSSIPTNGNSSNSFVTPNFSSYDSVNQSLTLNSPLKQTTTPVTISNFGCQSSQYLYPSSSLTPQNLYQTLPNSAAADAAAAIFQAYSQFNARPTPIPPVVNQQTTTQHQQIRK